MLDNLTKILEDKLTIWIQGGFIYLSHLHSPQFSKRHKNLFFCITDERIQWPPSQLKSKLNLTIF